MYRPICALLSFDTCTATDAAGYWRRFSPTYNVVCTAIESEHSSPANDLQHPSRRCRLDDQIKASMPSSSPQSSSPPQSQQRAKNPNRRNFDQDANIHNFAPVARIMKTALPENAKIAKEAKECMQECVSEFISFITSEGTYFFLAPSSGGY